MMLEALAREWFQICSCGEQKSLGSMALGVVSIWTCRWHYAYQFRRIGRQFKIIVNTRAANVIAISPVKK